MNYILNENKTQILVEGNWYDIYNDLKKVDPSNSTYIRQNKKNECYEYLLFNVEDVAKKLLNYSKFTNNASYKDLIDRYNNKNNIVSTNSVISINEPTNVITNNNINNDIINRLLNEINELKNIVLSKNKVEKNDNEIYHECFEDILRCIECNLPLMLVGGAGTGKNYTLEQVARHLGIEFFLDTSITQEFKITGFMDANGVYQKSNFYNACKSAIENGKAIYMIDELDASASEVLVLMNSAIANGYYTFPNGETLRFDNKLCFVSGANTFGHGANNIYNGRCTIDGATLDRFVTIKMDYDKKVEEFLCKDNELLEFVRNLRQVAVDNDINYIFGMRTLKNSYALLLSGMEIEKIIDYSIIKGVDIDSIHELKRKLGYKDTSKFKKWYDLFIKMY